jgi:DNA-binding transcriptional regulator LsrR (DeoR family)
LNEKELNRIIYVAQLYYEQNKTQAEIATELDISRPTVSYLLTKARKEGIVKIDVLSYYRTHRGINHELCQRFNLKSCHLVASAENPYEAAANIILKFLPQTRVFGLGWGINVSKIIEVMPEITIGNGTDKIVCPLIGPTDAPLRGYDPNELVKVLSGKIGFKAEYLDIPAFPLSEKERKSYIDTKNYKEILECWKKSNLAFVTFSSYPTVPDHGSALRFGRKLNTEKASGCLLSYFFNPLGEQIKSDDDFCIQVPLKMLKKNKHVIGFVPPEASIVSIFSALQTGFIDHLIIPEDLAGELIKISV